MQEALNIEIRIREEQHELILSGRLDAFGARTLEDELQAQMKAGHYQLILNFKEVAFLSSAGIRILIKHYKELKAVGGYLGFVELSGYINEVIELAGLKHLFSNEQPSVIEGEPSAKNKEIETTSGVFRLLDQKEKHLSLKTQGKPSLLYTGGYRAHDAETIAFPAEKYAIGLGAIGENFEACQSRFGEYIAVGDTAFYMPTDGTKSADYMQRTHQLIPQVVSLYSIVLEGTFGTFLTFEAKKPALSISLSELVQTAFHTQETKAVGIVMLAETTGLTGCGLNVSPVHDPHRNTPFSFPEIREEVYFTTEPAHAGCLTLTSGIIHKDAESLAPYTRPIGDTGLEGHFHSAVFGFRPMPKHNPDLRKVVKSLVEDSKLMNVLHLLDDNRQHNGIGESGFGRGACWVGAIDEFKNPLA